MWVWPDAFAYRGMFTLSTVHPLPTSPLFIPNLNLNGRAPPRNASVGLDRVDKPPDMLKWAEFHNGVAAGLQLAHGSSKVWAHVALRKGGKRERGKGKEEGVEENKEGGGGRWGGRREYFTQSPYYIPPLCC